MRAAARAQAAPAANAPRKALAAGCAATMAAPATSAGRLASGQAPSVVAGTLLAALTAPGDPVPSPPA